MVVHLYTLCWNEMDILPFVVDYWKRYVDHAWVYDNGSTDGSIEYLQQFDWITVEHNNTGGKLNDLVHAQIKNNCWKQSIGNADWVVVCDMDECLFPISKGVFSKMKEENCTICKPKWYDFISETKPEYVEGKLLHEISDKANFNPGAKVVLFDPNRIFEMNFGVGAHRCNPIGEVNYYDGDGVYLLHISNHLSLDYLIKKYKIMKNRLSDVNKLTGCGGHYNTSEEKITADFKKDLSTAVSFNDVISKCTYKDEPNMVEYSILDTDTAENPDIDIFIGTHKSFIPPVRNKTYKIIVGNHDIDIDTDLEVIKCGNKDDVLDDRFFSEIYMLKYLVKHWKFKKYVGFCHYRKYFSFMDNIPDMDEAFSRNDIIISKPIFQFPTVEAQYAICHNVEDLRIVGDIIKEKFSDYLEAYEVTIGSKIIVPYNMTIMRSDDFIDYVNFISGVLDEYVKIVGTDIEKRIEDNKDKYLKKNPPNSTVEYQYRIGGYLAERLTTIYIYKNFKKVRYYSIRLTELKYEKLRWK